MNMLARPHLLHCTLCLLPQKRLAEVNTMIVVDGAEPLHIARELGLTTKAVTDHIEHCLAMPVYAGRVVHAHKQRLEIDPEQIITRFMANIDAAQTSAEKLEERASWDKAAKIRLGISAQLGRFIETVMERAERIELTQRIEQALEAPLPVQAEQQSKRGKTAGEVLRAFGADALREPEGL